MQLVAYGAQDIYLTGNPQITFFKVVYRRHTNFSMECIKQAINGKSTIGTSSINNKGAVSISRNGDLVTGIYITCEVDTSEGVCGDHIISEVEIEIGGQRIDKHFREWNQIWNELTIPVSKSEGFRYMTGGYNNNLVSCIANTTNNSSGTSQRIIQYPLNFWFCRNPGLALPLIALQYHEVQLKITWGVGYYNSSSVENLTRKDVSLTSEKKVEVWVDYIYLDTDERRRFSQVSHEYLIEQLQVQHEKDRENTTFKLNLEHPIKELIWTTPNDSPIESQKIRLELNGHDRFTGQNKEYFTLKQPYIHHTSIPGYNIKEVEDPIMIKPIIITYNDDATASGTDNTTLYHSGSSTVNGKTTIDLTIGENFISSSTAGNYPRVGDILNIEVIKEATGVYDLVRKIIGQVKSVTKSSSAEIIVVEVDDSASAIGTSFTPSTPTTDIISISIIGRVQNPKSRCSQLKKDIYVYSFCLEPEEHQPSGTCNFSRIDSAKLLFDTNSKISNIYAVNYNVLRIMSGMAGLAYSS